MRLINCFTLELEKFLDTKVPPYVTLSHTWTTNEEVSFKNMKMQDPRRESKAGFQKIKFCCQQALKDGFSHAWVDTACIKKSSSAELSKAVRSMYAWYKNCGVCYVYLSDLHSCRTSASFVDDLRRCRWFYRGWTLQELIAPREVIFFNSDWVQIGTKHNLKSELADITGIDVGTLSGQPVKRISVARRMSWAAKRDTTRIEDRAYCLLGIFGIYMSLLYGEGERSFIRLQEKILRNSNDQTIFAWSTNISQTSTKSDYWGLLAPSPVHFAHCSHYEPLPDPEHSIKCADGGIFLQGLTNKAGTEIILKAESNSSTFCTLPIVRLRSGLDHFARRSKPHVPSVLPLSKRTEFVEKRRIFVRNSIHEDDYEYGHPIRYLRLHITPKSTHGYEVVDWFPKLCYDPVDCILKASPFPDTPYGAALYLEHPAGTHPPFIIRLLADQPKRRYEDSVSTWAVGVYSDTNRSLRASFSLFGEWLCDNQLEHLPDPVSMTCYDGVQAWKVGDDTFVRIYILPRSNSLGTVYVFVGPFCFGVCDAGSATDTSSFGQSDL